LGGDEITVHDALEILKFVVGLPNDIADCETGDSFNAALIVSEERPSVDDALEILKWLVGLPNVLDEIHGPRA
jgi:hypothetical protein